MQISDHALQKYQQRTYNIQATKTEMRMKAQDGIRIIEEDNNEECILIDNRWVFMTTNNVVTTIKDGDMMEYRVKHTICKWCGKQTDSGGVCQKCGAQLE